MNKSGQTIELNHDHHFQHIFYTDYEVHLDPYFDYLKTIKDNQPAAISDFFCDERLYLLHDEYTLHDAWVEKISLEHAYKDHLKSTTIDIVLLLSSHEKKVRMQYLDVAGLDTKKCGTAFFQSTQ